MKIIIDNYYAINHSDFCRVIESDKDISDIKEILAAIWFYYEDNMDGMKNGTDPTLDSIIDVLSKDFGFVPVDKDGIKEEIEFVIEQAEFNDYQSGIYCCKPILIDATMTYLEWYEVRDSLCGEKMSEKLYKKWLNEEIISDIKNLLIEEK